MTQNSRPGSTEMTTSIVEPEVEAWAKILSPNADSPLLVNFIRHALNMQRQPLHLQVSATMGDVKEVKRLIAGNSQSLDAISEENGRTALQAASAANQLEIVKILIESGSDVNAAPARLNGRTALQAAAEAGHCEVAKTLIEKGADLLARCCQRPNRMENHHECPGREAIYFAAENGHADMLVLLLDASIARGLKPSLESLLSAAARSGNSATVKTLLKRGAQLSKCIGDPYTPLHEAAHGGHDDAISLLLASGADLHAKCNEETVLFLAAERGHKQTVRLIMSKFATFEPVEEPEKEDKWLSWGKKPQKYESALHLAAERGIESAVKLLLDSGFDANGNTIGVASTPLICAAKSGNLAILRMLVERGADVNYVSPSSHNNALHEAATNGHVDAVRFLLSKGLDVNAPGGGDRQALHFAAATGNELLVRILVESGAQIATQMWNYGTPLHVAAKGGFKSVVEFFLSLGIDPMIQSVPDRPSRIALHEAADTGMEDVVALLLDNGCDPNAMDYMGETPLVLAVARGSLNCVRLLLDHGANVHQNLNRSRPLLHRLSGREFGFSKNKVDFQTEAEERREIALLLLQHNADIYAGDHGKRDALAFALEMNNLMITKVLLEHLPVSSGTGFDISPNLLTAASRGHYEIVKLLLDHGADPNHKFSGKTPLGAAAREGHTDIVEVLARRGADFTEPCYKGLTPLQLAAESGRYAVVESLLQLGAEVDSNVAAGTALELAARNGHADVVWLLVASGADCSRLGAEEINPREYEMKGRMPAVQRVLQRAEKSDFSPSYSSKSGRQERHS
jgi:ankyrin repeat protein